MRPGFRGTTPPTQQKGNVRAVHALVGVHLVKQDKGRSPIGSQSNTEKAREASGGQPLIQHLG
jgi:hypothetical protein